MNLVTQVKWSAGGFSEFGYPVGCHQILVSGDPLGN